MTLDLPCGTSGLVAAWFSGCTHICSQLSWLLSFPKNRDIGSDMGVLSFNFCLYQCLGNWNYETKLLSQNLWEVSLPSHLCLLCKLTVALYFLQWPFLTGMGGSPREGPLDVIVWDAVAQVKGWWGVAGTAPPQHGDCAVALTMC